MYDSRPNLVIGFHGCDRETRDKLLQNPDLIKKSEKPYDWLGHGMYFWEYNEMRALEWAEGYFRPCWCFHQQDPHAVSLDGARQISFGSCQLNFIIISTSLFINLALWPK